MKHVDLKRLALVAVIAIVVIVVFTVADPLASPCFPRCVLHQLTGLNCPGCGTSRALRELAHGHIVAALRFNSLTVLTLPFLILLCVRRETSTIKPGWIWLLLIGIIGFGVLRNIPVYPLTLLAPPVT